MLNTNVAGRLYKITVTARCQCMCIMPRTKMFSDPGETTADCTEVLALTDDVKLCCGLLRTTWHPL